MLEYTKRKAARNYFPRIEKRECFPAGRIAIVRRVGPYLISAGRPQRRIPVYVVRTRYLALAGAL